MPNHRQQVKPIMITMFALLLLYISGVRAGHTIAPYDSWLSSEDFIQGATLDLKPDMADVRPRLVRELQVMKDIFHINTINIYGLEDFAHKELLFSELQRLGMKAVVRLESYDVDEFAFETSDVNYVVDRYESLLRYTSQPAIRSSIAYYAINMPVDDGRVHSRLGSINSALSKLRQTSYSVEVVKRVRSILKAYGFNSAKIYLSVFYGWDNTYNLPSYSEANADGYFLNNYSYPVGKIADETSPTSELINQNRLQIAMDLFSKQYPGKDLVIESGFHTVEFNNGAVPNQTAGLVKDTIAKERAIKATLSYYQNNFTNVRGWLYFGYNLYKDEGDPPSLMDWTLSYPQKGLLEAEHANKYGKTTITTDVGASGGKAVGGFKSPGDGITFYNVDSVKHIKIRFSSIKESRLSLYINGLYNGEIVFPATSGKRVYAEKIITVDAPLSCSIKLQRDYHEAPTLIDYINVY